MEKLLKKFEEHLRYVDGASELTITNYLYSIRMFLEFLREYGIEPDDVDTSVIQEFIVWMGKRGLSRNSIVRHFFAVKKFLKFLGVTEVEWDKIKMRWEEKREYKILSEEEVKRIIDIAYAMKPMYGLMLQLGYEAGLRVSELVSAKVEDIDFGRCAFLKKPKKGGNVIEVPLSLQLCDKLLDWVREKNLNEYDYLFTTKFGKPWRPDVFTAQVFDRVAIAAGYVDRETGKPTIRYHDFARHSRATNLLRKGVDVYTVNKIMGHRLLQTTLIYLHLASADELRERIEGAERESTKEDSD